MGARIKPQGSSDWLNAEHERFKGNLVANQVIAGEWVLRVQAQSLRFGPARISRNDFSPDILDARALNFIRLELVSFNMDSQNPFLILGLAANASPKEIQQVGQLLTAQFRLADMHNTSEGRLIGTAIEQLRDPIARFRFGLEWPSLGPDAAALLKSHPSLISLRRDQTGNRDAAVELLLKGESLLSQNHIRAIFLLLRAHAVFVAKIESASRTAIWAPPFSFKLPCDLLIEGMKLLNVATESDEFWLAQRLRAKEINDPRLDAKFLAGLQAEFVPQVLRRFTTIAVESLRKRDTEACQAICKSILSCGAQQSVIDSVMMKVYESHCQMVTKAIEEFEGLLKTASGSQSSPYSLLLKRYQAEIEPDIQIMLDVGDLPGRSEKRTRDVAATFLRSLAVAAANKADAYSVSQEAILLAKKVVYSETILQKLLHDEDAVAALVRTANPKSLIGQGTKTTHSYTTGTAHSNPPVIAEPPNAVTQSQQGIESPGTLCAYCNGAVADGRSVLRKMYLSTQMGYSADVVSIPRCGLCQRHHNKRSRSLLLVSAGLILASGVFALSDTRPTRGIGGIIFFGVTVGVITANILIHFVLRRREQLKLIEYKPVFDRLISGWKYGSKH